MLRGIVSIWLGLTCEEVILTLPLDSRPDMLWLGADNSERPIVRVVAKE
jgi:hypothetical protein